MPPRSRNARNSGAGAAPSPWRQIGTQIGARPRIALCPMYAPTRRMQAARGPDDSPWVALVSTRTEELAWSLYRFDHGRALAGQAGVLPPDWEPQHAGQLGIGSHLSLWEARQASPVSRLAWDSYTGWQPTARDMAVDTGLDSAPAGTSTDPDADVDILRAREFFRTHPPATARPAPAVAYPPLRAPAAPHEVALGVDGSPWVAMFDPEDGDLVWDLYRFSPATVNAGAAGVNPPETAPTYDGELGIGSYHSLWQVYQATFGDGALVELHWGGYTGVRPSIDTRVGANYPAAEASPGPVAWNPRPAIDPLGPDDVVQNPDVSAWHALNIGSSATPTLVWQFRTAAAETAAAIMAATGVPSEYFFGGDLPDNAPEPTSRHDAAVSADFAAPGSDRTALQIFELGAGAEAARRHLWVGSAAHIPNLSQEERDRMMGVTPVHVAPATLLIGRSDIQPSNTLNIAPATWAGMVMALGENIRGRSANGGAYSADELLYLVVRLLNERALAGFVALTAPPLAATLADDVTAVAIPARVPRTARLDLDDDTEGGDA